MVKVALGKKTKQAAKVNLKFEIDCKKPVEDSVIVPKDLAQFLSKRIKVAGKAGNLQDNITLSSDQTKLVVTANIPFSKRYLKYLTKKYLKKMELREYLRVVASGKNNYELRYFKVNNEDDEE